jgi:hypothetical protein
MPRSGHKDHPAVKTAKNRKLFYNLPARKDAVDGETPFSLRREDFLISQIETMDRRPHWLQTLIPGRKEFDQDSVGKQFMRPCQALGAQLVYQHGRCGT